jgi:hypothetical protein
MAMLADEEIPFGADNALHHTALANARTRKLAPVVETSDDPASTSTDIGLRLLLQAISERGEMYRSLDTQAFDEDTVSMDLTLGRIPSFLDDICKLLKFTLSLFFN